MRTKGTLKVGKLTITYSFNKGDPVYDFTTPKYGWSMSTAMIDSEPQLARKYLNTQFDKLDFNLDTRKRLFQSLGLADA